MSSKQLSTEPIEPPTKRRVTRKGKGKGLPDTPSQEVDSSPLGQRVLAKRPMSNTQEFNSTGQSSPNCSRGERLGHQVAGSSLAACPWGSHLESITSLVVEISLLSRKFRSTIIDPLHGVLVHQETLLLQSENLQRSYLDLKECVQRSTPSSVPWHSHLAMINSLAVTISKIPQEFTVAITQLLEVNMESLSHQSESLQKSYFKLRDCVQQSLGACQCLELATTFY